MKIIILCFCLFLILCPFYFFSSGQPQIADFILLIAMPAFFFQRKHKVIFKDKTIKYLKYFISIVIFVNLTHSAISVFTDIKTATDFILSMSYYIYNAFVFVIALLILKNSTLKQVNIFYYTIIISLLIQTLLGALGITKGGFDETTMARSIIFFNNPNQLGYYVLLIYTLFVLISFYAKKSNLVVLLFVTLMCFYLSLLGGSRASMGGIFLLMFISIFLQAKFSLTKILQVAFLLVILIALFIEMNPKFIENKRYIYEMRQDRDRNRYISEFEVRGYDRIIKYPEYIFFGAGEGQDSRFTIAYHQGELHSGIGVLLFCYGIFGLFFFMLFIKKITQDKKMLGFLILLPIGIYNLTHQGLRQSLLWITFALLYYICSFSKYEIRRLPL